MNNHISTEEWILFFRGELSMPEKLPLLRHCAECPECKALLDKGNDLRFAAKRAAEKPESEFFADNPAFRAVAGSVGNRAASGTGGSLVFRLVNRDGRYLFADEEAEADGFGNRYAMNRTADGTAFLDDGGALAIQIEGRRLCLRFSDPGISATAGLIAGGRKTGAVPLAAEAVLDLGDDESCELEIVFRKE